MPAQESDAQYRNTAACLWVPSGINKLGRTVVGAVPTEIMVKWSDTRRELTDPQGNVIVIDAKVVVASNQVVERGSILWRGRVLDLPSNQIPTSDLMEVIVSKRTDDIKGRETRRTLMLARYNDQLPVS